MTTRDEYVSSIKESFVALGTKAAMGYLVAQYPFLSNKIFFNLVEFIVKKIMIAIVDGGELAVFFQYTDFRVNKQGNEFIEAALKNRQAQLTGSPEDKANAEKELMDAFAKFASLTS